MQTGIVERILEAAEKAIPHISDEISRQELLDAMSDFRYAITPSAIFLSEVHEYLQSYSLEISREDAIQILENAACDIDLNYATDKVIHHADNYISDISE